MNKRGSDHTAKSGKSDGRSKKNDCKAWQGFAKRAIMVKFEHGALPSLNSGWEYDFHG